MIDPHGTKPRRPERTDKQQAVRERDDTPCYQEDRFLAAWFLSVQQFRKWVDFGQVRAAHTVHHLWMPCSRLVLVSNSGYNGLWPHRSKGRIAEGVFSVPAASVFTPPPRSFDASGRALPLRPDEIDQRAALALQALDSLEDISCRVQEGVVHPVPKPYSADDP